MKNYLLVLLSVLGISFLINTSSEVKSNLSLEIAPYTEIKTEELLIPEIEEIAELSQEEIATAPLVTLIKAPTTGRATGSSYDYKVGINDNTVVKNPGNFIRRYNKFIYAHNSNNLLGSIRRLNVGSTFTVTETDGTTNTYQVASVQIFKKVDQNTLELCSLNDFESCAGAYYMNTLTNASFHGESYSIAMMTCDGTALGNGDATHRRVVFGYKI